MPRDLTHLVLPANRKCRFQPKTRLKDVRSTSRSTEQDAPCSGIDALQGDASPRNTRDNALRIDPQLVFAHLISRVEDFHGRQNFHPFLDFDECCRSDVASSKIGSRLVHRERIGAAVHINVACLRFLRIAPSAMMHNHHARHDALSDVRACEERAALVLHKQNVARRNAAGLGIDRMDPARLASFDAGKVRGRSYRRAANACDSGSCRPLGRAA